MEKIPIYDMMLKGGVHTVSLVENPAVESDYIALSDDAMEVRLMDEEKRLLIGAALIPDKLILRKDAEGSPFFIRFSKEVIRDTAYEYFRQKNIDSFNKQHDRVSLEGVYTVGGFIKDSSIGMNAPEKLNHLPDGTWFLITHVENDDVWNNEVKTGKLKGYSIEGFYGIAQSTEPTLEEKLEALLRQYLD